MKTITNTMTTKIVHDDNGGKPHRFILEKVWDTEKPKCTILMIFPSTCDPQQQDLTTILVQNNTSKLGFGGVVIWNLYSKLHWNSNDTEPNLSANDTCIAESAADPSIQKIIIAYGKGGESSKKMLKRQMEVLQLLEPHKSKIVEILSPCGKTGFHPLTPAIKNHWELVPLKLPNFKKLQKEQEALENAKNKKTKAKGKDKEGKADEQQATPESEAPNEETNVQETPDTPQEETE